MELSCYGFELQHSGIPVVWPFGTARIAYKSCTCIGGPDWRLLGPGYHKMGTRGG